MTAIEGIYTKLGLNDENGLYRFDIKHSGISKKVDRVFSTLQPRPNAIYCIEERPFILFFENPENKELLFKSIWNLNEAPIVILAENDTVSIYNGFEYLKEQKSLSFIGHENSLSDFEYFKLVTGETWEKYNARLSYKNRVDFKLLENIRDAREILITFHGLNSRTANALLGKTIFTRYLIDRSVRIGFDNELKEWSSDDFCTVLESKESAFDFFEYLQDKFGGNLFDFDESSVNITNDALAVVIDLLDGVTLKSGQLSLFDIFDFSIIPVEFISNVYELFIGQEEQAHTGAYYTPLFLVEYITSQTVQKFLEENPEQGDCKILDPACGSGIFLVEALRIIVERFTALNPNLSIQSSEYQNKITDLAVNNIFGIDKDGSAISVAIFSIYLTLLDYQNPRDIENFKFPTLLNTNLFVADFFDQQAQFNVVLQNQPFNLLIGNPPWKRGTSQGRELEPYEKYIRQRRKSEGRHTFQITISNKEIAQAFLLRSSDFCKEMTKVALIVTSKTLYNLNANAFRSYFLANYLIERIFELSPVRREVFNKSNDPAIAPAAIIFYRYAFGKNTDNELIEHISVKPSSFFSLFSVFMIHRNDIKTVKQKLLKTNDWLWKTLLYGHYLDYGFILRLSQFETIQQRIKQLNYLKGQGFQLGQDENSVDEIVGLKVLLPKYVTPFKVVEQLEDFTETSVHRVRNPSLYYGTRLLIKKGLNNQLKAVAAVIDFDCLFKDSITAIKIEDENGRGDLQTIEGLLQSDLFSYYALHRFSSIGVEREQGFNEEKFSFPFISNAGIDIVVAEIVKSLVTTEEDLIWPALTSKQTSQLNDVIYKAFSLSSSEKALIDYSNTYVIPGVVKTGSGYVTKISFKDEFLQKYIGVFLDRFKTVFKNNKSFAVEVWHSNHIIGLFFKVLDRPGENEKVEWENKSQDLILRKITTLGHQKLTDKLFIQKDIRGFEKDYFYIFKPNEKRLWHEALAYLDLNVFLDAILKTGREA